MLKNLLLVIFSTLLTLAVLEAALRGIGYGNELTYMLDEDVIYRPGPMRQKRYVRFPEEGGQVIYTRFDAYGFREGRGDPVTRDALRVFVYGDSFVQASYSKVEETFAGQLERRLAAATTDQVRAVNAGVDGYGP
jgi:hypothetical protein